VSKEEYINQLSSLQQQLNNHLMGAYQHDLKYKLEINEARSASKDDDRQVIGITVTSAKPVYKSDGVP